jgi:hypothetical protein
MIRNGVVGGNGLELGPERPLGETGTGGSTTGGRPLQGMIDECDGQQFPDPCLAEVALLPRINTEGPEVAKRRIVGIELR